MGRATLSLFLLFGISCGEGVTVQPSDVVPGVGGRADDPNDTPGDDVDVSESCVVPTVPLAGRPLDVMDPVKLDFVASRLPCVGDEELLAVLESPDTVWYDKHSIVPAYQDSSGDNVTFPVGLRPNTINPNLIVEGGHEAFFENLGTFHFPFGRPIGSSEDDVAVVNFWQLPRDEEGELAPAVWWFRQPNGFTWRYEWMFPVGTIFGEALFVVDSEGSWWPFEFRTRRRHLTGWNANVYRPFPEAAMLAEALESTREEVPAWSDSEEIDALVARLGDDTLEQATLTAPKLSLSFDAVDGAKDVLPSMQDASILRHLLLEKGFVSAQGKVWKQGTEGTAYAPTTEADFHIVPKGYTGGFIAVDDESCEGCHVDAGRPFKEYHFFVYLYGEVWGGDQVFTWHPFESSLFVNENGTVKNFNHDNRQVRQDFLQAGVVEAFDELVHDSSRYQRIVQPWSDFSY